MSARPRQEIIILLVEDTIEFATLTAMSLKRIGLQVAHAKDGDEAFEFLQNTKPDLVLLDLNLPGKSGWQVMEEMGRLYGEKTIPVIVTSAYSDGANRVIGKLQDVYKYMIKPFSPKELVVVVEQALGLPITP